MTHVGVMGLGQELRAHILRHNRKAKINNQPVMAHAFNPNNQVAEASGTL